MAAINGSQVNALRIFEAKEDDDVDLWIANVEQCQAEFGWTDEQTAEVAKLRMGGDAAQWIRTLALGTDPFECWGPRAANAANNIAASIGFRQALINRFRVTSNQITATDAIVHLKQEVNEAGDAFFDRVVLAVDKLHYGLTAAQRQEAGFRTQTNNLRLALFNAGLREIIRSRLMADGTAPPTDVQRLRDKVRQIELQLKLEKKSGKVFSMELEEEAAETLEEKVEALTKKFEGINRGQRFRGRSSSRGRGRGSKAHITCYNCSRQGHYSFECFQKKNNNLRGRFRGRGRGRRGRQNISEIGENGSEAESWTYEAQGNEQEEM